MDNYTIRLNGGDPHFYLKFEQWIVFDQFVSIFMDVSFFVW